MAVRVGLEPTTLRLTGDRTNRLCYQTIMEENIGFEPMTR